MGMVVDVLSRMLNIITYGHRYDILLAGVCTCAFMLLAYKWTITHSLQK